MTKRMAAPEAVALIPNDAVIVVNSSRGLCCPDAELEELGNRFRTTGEPGNLTTIHPIAAGGFFGIMGVDHIVMPGCLACIIGGSYPSGPTKADPPLVWQMIMNNETGACNVQSGIVFDMLRKAEGLRPGVLTGVGMDTFVDPELDTAVQ